MKTAEGFDLLLDERQKHPFRTESSVAANYSPGLDVLVVDLVVMCFEDFFGEEPETVQKARKLARRILLTEADRYKATRTVIRIADEFHAAVRAAFEGTEVAS